MTMKHLVTGPDWIVWAVFVILVTISAILLSGHGTNLIDVVFYFTRKQTKEFKNPKFKFMPHNVNFDYLPANSKKHISMEPYTMKLRFSRFKISDNSYELVVTNLDRETFSSATLKELYAMRWGIETSFRALKYTLALLYFRSKKTEHILQEIFAKLTMHNFVELIISHTIIKQNKRKHTYQVNFSCAVHICYEFFSKNISPFFKVLD